MSAEDAYPRLLRKAASARRLSAGLHCANPGARVGQATAALLMLAFLEGVTLWRPV